MIQGEFLTRRSNEITVFNFNYYQLIIIINIVSLIEGQKWIPLKDKCLYFTADTELIRMFLITLRDEVGFCPDEVQIRSGSVPSFGKFTARKNDPEAERVLIFFYFESKKCQDEVLAEAVMAEATDILCDAEDPTRRFISGRLTPPQGAP